MGGRWPSLRSLHGVVRRSHRSRPAHPDVRDALRRLRCFRPVHCCQLLAHLHHPRRTYHAREIHQRLRTSTARARSS